NKRRFPETREMILATFAFTNRTPPSLIGRWAGQGAWYRFLSDGTLRLALADNSEAVGTYSINNGAIRMNYNRLSLPFQRSCLYTLSESRLVLECGDLTSVLERRADF